MHLNRTYGSRKVPVELPMFPGYMFLKGSLDEVYTADRTKRIAHIIRVADQQKITWELRNLALAHERGAVFEPFPYLQVGLKVEIQSGSFQGIQGIIESKTKRDRVILQVGVLGQATSLEIDGAILSVIE
jgi:transcription antitermination factor NusG